MYKMKKMGIVLNSIPSFKLMGTSRGHSRFAAPQNSLYYKNTSRSYSCSSVLRHSIKDTIHSSSSIQKRFNSNFSSREQLLDDILFVYNDLTSTTRWSMPHDQFESLLLQIASDEFHLSPLRYLLIPEHAFSKYHAELLISSYPDIMIRKSRSHRGCIEVLLPHKDDVVVYTGLSRFLYRLSNSRISGGSKGVLSVNIDSGNNDLGLSRDNDEDPDNYRILNPYKIESFYKSLLGRRVQRLYSIELDESLNFIPKRLLLETLSPILLDRSVYRLISELMELNILHNDMYLPPSPYGIPTLGEICRVLFNLYLAESFDPGFARKYPSIEFERYYDTVFLFIRNDEQEQAFNGIEDMLADLELINGHLKSIDHAHLGSMYSRIGPVKKVIRIAPDGTLERGEDRFDCI